MGVIFLFAVINDVNLAALMFKYIISEHRIKYY